MKTNINIMTIGAVGFAAFATWAYFRSAPGAATAGGIFDILKANRKESGAAVPANTQQIAEVLDNGSPFSNGWRYFTDGTSISPTGSYYSGGDLVWTPA